MDDERVAVVDQLLGLLGDRLLGVDAEHLVLFERPRREAVGAGAVVGRGDAAEHFADRAQIVQLADVAADGGGRGDDDLRKIAHGRERPVAQEAQDVPMTLAFIHGRLDEQSCSILHRSDHLS